MDYADLFNITRVEALVASLATDTDIDAAIRARLSAAANELQAAMLMVDSAISVPARGEASKALTADQRAELAEFRASISDGYGEKIKERTRERFSDAGVKRERNERAKTTARLAAREASIKAAEARANAGGG